MNGVVVLQVKARGRFGCVWKAQLLNETVAVKIFPGQEERSWRTEVSFFRGFSSQSFVQF